MSLFIALENIQEEDRSRVGGKAYSLARMIRHGISVPDGICVADEAYKEYLRTTGLRTRIELELSRKDFTQMRWEEIWDASLRIRNLFLTTPVPERLEAELRLHLAPFADERPTVVRSSAPGEDAATASFAGLHESFVDVRGVDALVEHVRLVWASLWSDAALLYRQELGLDVENSSMAVIVQDLVEGDASGVAFGQNPLDETQAVVEAVRGLNNNLVDGAVEPDRWIVQRSTGKIVAFRGAPAAQPSSAPGAAVAQIDPVLDDEKVLRVYDIVTKLEALHGQPQDVEWTFRNDRLYILQSRPITTRKQDDGDGKRPWYLSLRRSFDNLRKLRDRIELTHIPAMLRDADRLAETNLSQLPDRALAEELRERTNLYGGWIKTYWADFIPFAHGVRLFGATYNDALRPSDPYEFMDLLVSERSESMRRNGILEQLADLVREDPILLANLQAGEAVGATFHALLSQFIDEFGDLFCSTSQCLQGEAAIIDLVLQMASRPRSLAAVQPGSRAALEKRYLASFLPDRQAFAGDLLNLARASYRLRDDDNVYIGKIRGQLVRTVNEYRDRLGFADASQDALLKEAVDLVGEAFAIRSQPDATNQSSDGEYRVNARQLLGQPAGPGVAQGLARVILDAADLYQFRAGEVLVCEAIDPSLTFVVPLCVAIVERRGGMLIHGAIIAREYGIPCVTGIPDATSRMHTGDTLTVDGYLGIVIIGTGEEEANRGTLAETRPGGVIASSE